MSSVIASVDWEFYAPEIGRAVLRTLEIAVVSFTGAVLLGMVVALVRMADNPIRYVAAVYTELLKNVPAIVPIFILYFGLTSLGIVLSTFVAGCLALILFYAAYLAETFRGGLQGVPDDQREATRALGFTGAKSTWYVVLPQAVRISLPAAGTIMIDLVKATSLLVVISAGDLMSQGAIITADTFAPLEVYLVVGGLYFLLCWPLSQGVLWLERLIKRGVPLSPRRRRTHALVRARLNSFDTGAER